MRDPDPTSDPRLPRWLSALVRWLLPRGIAGESALGDLNEDFRERTRSTRTNRLASLLAYAAHLSSAVRLCVGYTLPALLQELPLRKRSRVRRRRHGAAPRSTENPVTSHLSGLVLDLRTAVRSLRRRPLLSAVALVSLAVGLGANTAIFSLVNVLFLRPLPGIENQERVIEIGRTSEGRGFDSFNYLDFQDLRAQQGPIEELALWTLSEWSLAVEDGGRRLNGLYVTPSYFRALGVRAARGRLLRDRSEDDLGERGVVVLSHRMWQNELGGDEAVVGSQILLNRRPYVVVGVTDPAFKGHTVGAQMALFVPMSESREIERSPDYLTDRRAVTFLVLGRLAAGTTPADADAMVRTVMRNLAETYPETNGRRGARVVPLGPVPGGGRGPVRGFSALLMALVVLLLCATCANVAGILTAKALSRERELGTRLALGCGRGRLLRMLMLEAVLLAVAGGAAGLGLAVLAVRAVDLRRLPIPLDLHLDVSPDLRVFGFGLALAMAAALLVGLPAAFQASTISSSRGPGGGGWRHGAGGSRWRRLLVGTQVAGALVLALIGALFLRSLERASRIETGFDPSGVMLTSIDLALEGYADPERGRPLLDALIERVEAIPGVERAAFSKDLPLDLASHGTGVVPESWALEGEPRYLSVDYNLVSPGYFEALRVSLLEGRLFEERDRDDAERVAVVSRTFAARWPESDRETILGARFRFGSLDGPWVRVVGVVEDTKNRLLMEEAVPFVYLPLAQRFATALTLVARSNDEELSEQLRTAILEVDPSLSLTPVLRLGQVTGLGTLPQRLAALLGAALGGFALLLAGLGIYGVVAFQVTERVREIGVRMAIGEGRGAVTRRIVAGAFRLAFPGLVVGSLLGAGLARLLRGMLLGSSPLDPIALVVVAAMVSALVALASLFPARRAASVDPVEALRAE